MSVDNLSPLSTLILAGAEGLEPSARGFGGAKTYFYKSLSCVILCYMVEKVQ